MKSSILKIYAVAGALAAASSGYAVPISITQSLDIWVERGGTQSISFTGLTEAASDAVLGVTARGDINEVGEFVSVFGEGGLFLADLFNGVSRVPETGFLTIAVGLLDSWLIDGVLDLTLGIAENNGSEKAWLLSATLSYTGVDENNLRIISDDVPTSSVPDAGSSVAMLGLALGAIGLVARRKRLRTV